MSDLQELKEDIKDLDMKITKSEENTNKRLEKIENNIIKSNENHSESMKKMIEVISGIELMLAKNYVEKKDLDKLEINLTEDIKETNKAVSDTNIRIDGIEKNNAIDIPMIVKYTLFFIFSTSFGYLFTLAFK